MKKRLLFLFFAFIFITPSWADWLERTKNTIWVNPFGDSEKKLQKTMESYELEDPNALNEIEKQIQTQENKIRNPGLFSSAEKEREKLVNMLNTVNKYGTYPIFFPITQKNYQLTKKMLDYGANPNAIVQDIYTPLIQAIAVQDYSIVKLLVAYGADCNSNLSSSTKKNMTPLMKATFCDNIEIIKFILSQTNNVNTVYMVEENGQNDSFTPLQELIIKSISNKTTTYDELIYSLIDRGANINAKIDDWTLIQALCLYYDKDKLRIIEKLSEKGSDCGAIFHRLDSDNNPMISTPLFEAVLSENSELASFILGHINKSQIDNEVSIKNFHGTVLSWTTALYSSDNPKFYWFIIEQLIQKGANPNSFLFDSEQKESVLMNFIESADAPIPLDKIEFLLKNGADPNIYNTNVDENKNAFSYTAVQYAAAVNNTELLNLLEKYGGDLKLEDSKGKNALFYMSQHIDNDADRLNFYYKNGMSTEAFLNSNPKWDDKTKTGVSILQIAISNNDDDLARHIIEKNLVSWAQEDNQGTNALSYALIYNRTKVIDYFIEKKIKIGKSIFYVIDYAIKDGNMEFLSQFLQYQDFKGVTKRFGDNRTPVDPIIYAALVMQNTEGLSKNRNNVMELLLDNKAKFTVTGRDSKITDDGQYPILATEDEEVIVKLLDYGANYELTDNNRKNAIDYAFEKNQIFVIDWLLEHKAKIGNSLFYAIDNELEGHDSHIADFIQLDGKIKSSNITRKITVNNQIIQCGPVVYSTMVKSESPLPSKRIQILSELFASGFSPDETVSGGNYNGNTALIFATMNNNTEVAQFLLENNANVNLANKGQQAGRNALFYAIENKKFELANLIIQKMGTNFQDFQLQNSADNRATLLMFIAKYGDFNFAQATVPPLVKQKKSALESRDRAGMTPFLYAAAYNPDAAVLKVFRAYTANVYAVTNEKENARQLAEKNNNSEEVKSKLEDYGVFKE